MSNFVNPYPTLYGNYLTKTFVDIFPEYAAFEEMYKSSAFYKEGHELTDDNIELLYYLLYARHGNDPTRGDDEFQFCYKVFSIIFTHGPSWQKRLDIQKIIRELNEDEITKGSKGIYNKSYNPSTKPTTNTLEELPTINEQFTNGWRKSKLEGYAMLMQLMASDVTEEFLVRFDTLFDPCVATNLPLWYESEV